MALNQPYQHQPSAIASYSYTDLAEGTGIVKYFAYQEEDNLGLGYKMGTSQIYSGGGSELSGGSATNTFSKVKDVDFDLTTYNAPNTIRGTATINACIASNANGGYSSFTYVIFGIMKYSGTTETLLLSGQSPIVAGGNASTTNEIVNVQIPLNKTHFKKGDILRLNAEIWNYVDAGGAGFWSLGVDPMNRDGTYIIPSTDSPTSTTKLEVFIPYDLDL